jgi:NAD(P)-dependent dehydrogenase (short-subunit alcohol dehydrogenase family)
VEHGATVVIADLKPPMEEIFNTIFVKTDVTKWDDLVNVFQETLKRYGRVDVVFANAGELSDDSSTHAKNFWLRRDRRCVRSGLLRPTTGPGRSTERAVSTLLRGQCARLDQHRHIGLMAYETADHRWKHYSHRIGHE